MGYFPWDSRSGPWGNRSGPWGNRSGPWGNRSGPWGNRSGPWGNRSGPWGNRSGPWGGAPAYLEIHPISRRNQAVIGTGGDGLQFQLFRFQHLSFYPRGWDNWRGWLELFSLDRK